MRRRNGSAFRAMARLDPGGHRSLHPGRLFSANLCIRALLTHESARSLVSRRRRDTLSSRVLIRLKPSMALVLRAPSQESRSPVLRNGTDLGKKMSSSGLETSECPKPLPDGHWKHAGDRLQSRPTPPPVCVTCPDPRGSGGGKRHQPWDVGPRPSSCADGRGNRHRPTT